MYSYHHWFASEAFDKKAELEQYQNIKLQGDRWVGFEWVNNDPRSQELGVKGEGAFGCIIDCPCFGLPRPPCTADAWHTRFIHSERELCPTYAALPRPVESREGFFDRSQRAVPG